MIFLSKDDTERLFDWSSAVDCIQRAYQASHADGSQPGRLVARERSAWIRCMPSVPAGAGFMGTKQISRTSEGRLAYVITLFDRQTGELEFLIDAVSVTAMRTAATSAAAIARLSADEPVHLAVLGSGLEAAHHVQAIAQVRRVRSLAVYSPTQANRDRFAKRFRHELGIEVVAAASAREAVEGASVVVAAARSHGEVPILSAPWLAQGAVVVSIGSTTLSQRELDVSVLSAADLIVADVPHELRDDTGDLQAAVGAGINVDAKLFSLEQLMRGEVPGTLTGPGCLRVFKSVGAALQDIAFAEHLALAAVKRGVGTRLHAPFHIKQSAGRNS
jgi:alanine dehydrogenase